MINLFWMCIDQLNQLLFSFHKTQQGPPDDSQNTQWKVYNTIEKAKLQDSLHRQIVFGLAIYTARPPSPA